MKYKNSGLVPIQRSRIVKKLLIRSLNKHAFSILFSICTLVTNKSEYEEMIRSFRNSGFTEDICEFLYIDNSENNQFDAYDGLNRFLNIAQGKYIILCHQDILLDFDDILVLKKRIDEIDSTDPNWAVLGNAGYQDFNIRAIRITDPWGDNQNSKNLPRKVKSVDENFILVKNEANLALSKNIGGFHLYGTDLCLIAEILGYNSYVIDFHIRHKSGGACTEDFLDTKKKFIAKYKNVTKPRFIRTPCTIIIVTSCGFLNSILNRKLVYSLKKRWDYIVAKFRARETRK